MKQFIKRAIFLVFLVFLGIFLSLKLGTVGKIYAQKDPDPFYLAKCLTGKGFVMYGREGCSACALEKSYFGEAFSYVSFFDCQVNEGNKKICTDKGISGYPTWEDSSGKQYKGAIPLNVLADLSDCQQNVAASPVVSPVKENPIGGGEVKKTGGAGFSLMAFLGATAKNSWSLFLLFISEYGGIFIAGIVSFFAPCLIPLLPTYLSVISGYTFADLYGLEFSTIRRRVFFSALFFVLGFSVLFTLIGATGTLVGQFINQWMPQLLTLSGVVMIILGLVQLHIIKIPALEFDFAWVVQRRLANLGFLSSMIIGVASALCWIPCIGPILATILVLSANSASVFKGVLYLLVYSLGIMLPFLLAALFFPSFFDFYRERRGVLRFFSAISGGIIIIFGLVLIFNKYGDFINWYNSLVNNAPVSISLEKLIRK